MDSAGMTVLVEYGLPRHDSLGGIGCTQMEVEAADRDPLCTSCQCSEQLHEILIQCLRLA